MGSTHHQFTSTRSVNFRLEFLSPYTHSQDHLLPRHLLPALYFIARIQFIVCTAGRKRSSRRRTLPFLVQWKVGRGVKAPPYLGRGGASTYTSMPISASNDLVMGACACALSAHSGACREASFALSWYQIHSFMSIHSFISPSMTFIFTSSLHIHRFTLVCVKRKEIGFLLFLASFVSPGPLMFIVEINVHNHAGRL